jgi:hypothetical protein
MKTIKKVNHSDYKDKYDKTIKSKLETSPDNIDVETMRANLYGYTFTKEYAEGRIPDELSMDYWEEYHLENDDYDFDLSPQEKLILETIDSTGDGKIPETALCVIDVHQEYEYIARSDRFFLLQLVRQSVDNGIDCLEFKNYKGDIEKVYFDISRRFEVDYKCWTIL